MASGSAVEGMEITPEEDIGWMTAITRRRRRALAAGGKSVAIKDTNHGGKGSRCTATSQNVLRRVATASRIPMLPKDHIKIIVRPRGGLDVKKFSLVHLSRALAMASALAPEDMPEDTYCPNGCQNILVVSTPREENAIAYAKVRKIHTRDGPFEVAAYTAAGEDTCKGVVRGIDLDISDAELKTLFVNHRNPGLVEVRRIKQTTTVVVLFEGQRVPNHVICGNVLMPCYLYRRQIDVCYGCGEIGHRSDVCPNPASVRKCRGCGITSPPEDHHCDPKCAICGGAHPTGDRKCSRRFQMPYIVRQRRRRR